MRVGFSLPERAVVGHASQRGPRRRPHVVLLAHRVADPLVAAGGDALVQHVRASYASFGEPGVVEALLDTHASPESAKKDHLVKKFKCVLIVWDLHLKNRLWFLDQQAFDEIFALVRHCLESFGVEWPIAWLNVA